MKKILSLMLLAALTLPIMAQDASEKKAKDFSDYLPAAGDMSIGFSANPFLKFVGNMFNGTAGQDYNYDAVGGNPYTNGVPGFTYPTVSISGKYMLSDNLGVRVNLGWVLNTRKEAAYVEDQHALALNPLSEQKVIDTYNYKQNGGSLSAGLEYRIGKHRVQGVFAGSLLYAFKTESEQFTYGNAITEINQKPLVSSVAPAYAAHGAMPNARTQKISTDGTHTAGLVGAVGIEYFVAPKISIGAEVNLALLYSWTPNTYSVKEGYNTLNGKVEQHTDLSEPASSDFVFGTENIGSNIHFNFYF